MPLYIGTSGWQYRDWRESFYPRELRQRDWLRHYARRFQTVEVNNTFYRLPERSSFRAWAEETPDDFIVALKMSRFLTHIKRLKDPEEPLVRFFDRAEPLGRKLGPVLLQLPPNLRADLERLEAGLQCMPQGVRVAVEFRHDSWYTEETRDLLQSYGAALCLADRESRLLGPPWRTADWGYVRLHSGQAQPAPCYGRTALEGWAKRIAERWRPEDDVFIFFNNDPHACAVHNARQMGSIARRHGLRPSRVPEAPEVRLAA